MTTYKLRGRMHNDVGSVLNGSDKIGCSEGVVDDKRKTVRVGDGCRTLYIRYV